MSEVDRDYREKVQELLGGFYRKKILEVMARFISGVDRYPEWKELWVMFEDYCQIIAYYEDGIEKYRATMDVCARLQVLLARGPVVVVAPVV